MIKRTPKQPWTREEFDNQIVKPIQQGIPVNTVAKNLGLTRDRVYKIFKIFGYNNRKDILQIDLTQGISNVSE